jgi:replicative DNA helicase
MAFFLNHLFAANGSVWVERQSAAVSYLSSSERLARDVQHLLLRFGVLSRVRQKPRRPGEPRHQRWELQVSEPASVRRFATDIGILGRDDEMRRARAATDATGARSAVDGGSLDAQVALLARGRAARAGHPVGGAPSAGVGAAGVLERRELAVQPSADVCWDEVVTIAYDGDEQVYDLTVPELHNFVAGDVFVHNTSFALGAAANAALVSRRPTLFFSMEMGKLELTKRLLAAEARVDAKKLWTGNIPEGDWTRLSHAVGRLAEAPLFIDDNAHCTVMEMRAKARRIKARYGDLGLIVVDYVQLMSSGVRHAENRQVEVSELSRGLKILARDLECPVMALSQLNRQLEYRQDKRPMLADLRESGALEQDADVVCFIYRDEIYNPESDQRGTAEIIVAKHRNGPTGSTRLAFLDHITKFANMARD